MGLNRKNGTLKGVEVNVYNPDIEEWEETKAIGYKLSDGGFFIGVGENENGYNTEIAISKKALLRMLTEIKLY